MATLFPEQTPSAAPHVSLSILRSIVLSQHSILFLLPFIPCIRSIAHPSASAVALNPSGETGASGDDKALVHVPADNAVSFAEFEVTQPPTDNSWLCRFTYVGGPCADRSFDGIGPWRFCPSGSCCSKTMCAHGSCGGAWCATWNSGNCVFYHDDYANGRCSCDKRGTECSKNGSCKEIQAGEGGVFCYCNPGYIGDGRTCESDPCYSSPCSPGTCSRMGSSYVCSCPAGYTQDTSRGYARCVEKADSCRAAPCGSDAIVDDCVSFDSGAYECICKDGYVSNGTKCEKQDWCKNNPCGDANAVYDCISNDLDYTCNCQKGYVQVVTDEGDKKCAKNPCSYDPCGAAELVKQCVNKSDGTYACVCSDIAEVGVDEDTSQIKCLRKDPCLKDPCGPSNAVRQCFVDGNTYGCVCASGYSVVPDSTGAKKCVFGDPCQLGKCGVDEAVENCSTNGQAYTCECSAEAILSRSSSGEDTCVLKSECEENCGAIEGVTRCEKVSDGKWDCQCKAGYLLKYVKGTRMCHKADACSVNPCGSSDAVSECQVNSSGDGYTCICNSGYELRTQSDNTQLCALPNSCIGDPCGKPEAVSLCVPTKDSYTCTCNPEYSLQTVYGKLRCVRATSDDDLDSDSDTSSDATEGDEGVSTVMIAGCVVGSILLLGVLAYAGRSRSDEEEEPRPPPGGPYMGPQMYGQQQQPMMNPGMPQGGVRQSLATRQSYAMDTRPSFWG
ncbi:unnamed protein product [Neospora caninum Liverpool]|uniref:Microneme protein, putative n=1 Tax=Neospora caninum (strain Liverpool) TaxID=572307 RepID=F0VEE4_NEOCL|nr:uncharacterized protein NCLIV_018780 [Neospora caninum Liverpool]CBZ52088.1 unnamed protein product [Neospora caninum Liverpool]CEL66050.1 TPA: microneme protein, putative [Neospora caninum Liverpool]|eukprot:XP_003882120.1 uncharacterized protein NCLIV_018780 [Neospora caninum Liverpool]